MFRSAQESHVCKPPPHWSGANFQKLFVRNWLKFPDLYRSLLFQPSTFMGLCGSQYSPKFSEANWMKYPFLYRNVIFTSPSSIIHGGGGRGSSFQNVLSQKWMKCPGLHRSHLPLLPNWVGVNFQRNFFIGIKEISKSAEMSFLPPLHPYYIF